MSDTKRALTNNFVGRLAGARKRSQYRQCAVFINAQQDCGRRGAEGLKLDVERVSKPAGMSAEDRAAGPGSS